MQLQPLVLEPMLCNMLALKRTLPSTFVTQGFWSTFHSLDHCQTLWMDQASSPAVFSVQLSLSQFLLRKPAMTVFLGFVTCQPEAVGSSLLWPRSCCAHTSLCCTLSAHSRHVFAAAMAGPSPAELLRSYSPTAGTGGWIGRKVSCIKSTLLFHDPLAEPNHWVIDGGLKKGRPFQTNLTWLHEEWYGTPSSCCLTKTWKWISCVEFAIGVFSSLWVSPPKKLKHFKVLLVPTVGDFFFV